jgi:hypothetical protein
MFAQVVTISSLMEHVHQTTHLQYMLNRCTIQISDIFTAHLSKSTLQMDTAASPVQITRERLMAKATATMINVTIYPNKPWTVDANFAQVVTNQVFQEEHV